MKPLFYLTSIPTMTMPPLLFLEGRLTMAFKVQSIVLQDLPRLPGRCENINVAFLLGIQA